MEKAYALRNHGMMPQIKYQGSDHYLSLQFKECQRGQIGWFSEKQIISKLPDVTTFKTRKEEHRKADGTYEVVDTEIKEPPATWNLWKEQTQIFRTSLLMCIASNSQHANLEIDKTELDAFYDWLEGTEFASHPIFRVPLARVRSAEREAWRKICLKIHERIPLREALTAVRSDYLFWTPLLMAEMGAGHSATQDVKGKGKWKAKQRPRWPTSPPRGAKGKGRDGGKASSNKPKGKGKGAWSGKDAGGRQYCWAYNQGKCQGKCNRVHRCCMTLKSGYACNSRHAAMACTRS